MSFETRLVQGEVSWHSRGGGGGGDSKRGKDVKFSCL